MMIITSMDLLSKRDQDRKSENHNNTKRAKAIKVIYITSGFSGQHWHERKNSWVPGKRKSTSKKSISHKRQLTEPKVPKVISFTKGAPITYKKSKIMPVWWGSVIPASQISQIFMPWKQSYQSLKDKVRKNSKKGDLIIGSVQYDPPKPKGTTSRDKVKALKNANSYRQMWWGFVSSKAQDLSSFS